MEMETCNVNTQEAEVGEKPQVQGKLNLYCEFQAILDEVLLLIKFYIIYIMKYNILLIKNFIYMQRKRESLMADENTLISYLKSPLTIWVYKLSVYIKY